VAFAGLLSSDEPGLRRLHDVFDVQVGKAQLVVTGPQALDHRRHGAQQVRAQCGHVAQCGAQSSGRLDRSIGWPADMRQERFACAAVRSDR
jgi:hypothetical protein